MTLLIIVKVFVIFLSTSDSYEMVNRNMGGNNPQNPAMPDVNDFLQDHKEKRKLLERWPHYFPHEPIKDFDPNDFKHLCIQVFFEAFSLPEF